MHKGLAVKVGQGGKRSLQAPAKKGSLEGAATCNLEGEHSVLDKKKVKFSTSTHQSEGLLKRLGTCLEVTGTLSLLLIVYLGIVGYIP